MRINNASSWFSLHGHIAMHGPQNLKKRKYILLYMNSAQFSEKNFSDRVCCQSDIYICSVPL